jgi:chromosome segregation ATPase
MEDSASSVFGDSDTFTAASSQLTRVKAAIDNAEDVINSNQPSAATDAYGAQSNEDIELVTSALNIAQTEIQRAQMHLSEWTSIGDMRVKQINASLSEAQAYGGEIQARLSYASAYQQASAARGQEGQNRIAQANTTLSVAQQELARANAAIAEINVLMGSYRLELEGVGPYLQAATGYISQAQGYVAEANTRMQREEQKYKWYRAQQAKLQADYDRGIQLLARG